MLTVLLLQCACLVVLAEIQQLPQSPLQNGNSLLTGRMSPELIKQLADVAYTLMKSDRKGLSRRRKKPKASFMDYDDAVLGHSKDLAVLAAAPQTMLNSPRPGHRNVQKQHINRIPLATLKRPSYRPAMYTNPPIPLPPADGYVLPPEGMSHKRGRWTVVLKRRYRIHGKGRRIRQPVP